MFRTAFCLAAVVSLLAGTTRLRVGAQSPAVSYTVTRIDLLPGTTRNWPTCISQNGQVAGQSVNGSLTWHAWSWAPLTDIPTLGGYAGIPYGINNAGTVVGESQTNSYASKAFLYSGAKVLDLTKKGGSRATAINNLSDPQVVGSMPLAVNSGGTQGFAWQGGRLTNLRMLPNGYYAVPHGINDSGVVVGVATVNHTNIARAVYWPSTSSAPVDLSPTLGEGSSAVAINASGQVVGTYSGGVFLWDLGPGTWQTIGQFTPLAMNHSVGGLPPVIVGYASSGAVKWENGVLTDLNTLIDPGLNLRLGRASGVSDAGLICCTAQVVDPTTGAPSEEIAVVLTPL